MLKKISWGVLGAAKIAREQFIPAINLSKNGYLSAIASRSKERAFEVAAPYTGIECYDNYADLINNPNIDAVYIPLANRDHIKWTLQAIQAGKHVLCEKPIALKAADIDQLILERDRRNLVVAEAFMVTQHSQWLRTRDILESGELGALRKIQGSFSYFNNDLNNIRNQLEMGGGGLLDIGVYPVVTSRFVTQQEPNFVQAKIKWINNVDTEASVWMDFDDFSADFYISMRMSDRQEMVFHCEKGWLRVTSPFNAGLYGEDRLEIRDQQGNYRVERFPGVNQYVEQAENFNNAILTQTPYSFSLEQSKLNQQVIDAIYRSGKEGVSIAL